MNKPFDLINEIQKRLEFVSVDFKGLNKSYKRKNPCDPKMLQPGLKSSKLKTFYTISKNIKIIRGMWKQAENFFHFKLK